MRFIRERMVTKLVSMPPSQRCVDVGHVGALSRSLDSILSLLLGADKENLAAMCAGVLDERVCGVGLHDGLLEVENVDAAALAEDVRLHLGVPATGLMTKVAAGLEKGADINLGSHVLPPGLPPHGVDLICHSALSYLGTSTAAGK